jgi:hypothetical protein
MSVIGRRAGSFEILRDHSRGANRKLADVTAAIVDGPRLLPKQPETAPNRALVLRALKSANRLADVCARLAREEAARCQVA